MRYNYGMHERDTTEKTLESHNDVFADIVNVLLFGGRQVVSENDLTDAQPFSQYKAADGELHSQERDVAKYWQNSTVRLSLFGFENQTKVESAMPARVIGYDGAAYRSQLNEGGKLYPVITLVLYFGTEHHWTASPNLKAHLEITSELEPFVNDYKAHIFELAWLTDEQINSFQSDFRIVAEYLRALRTGEAEDWTRQKLWYVSEIIDLFRVISDDEIFDTMADFIEETQTEKGGVNVCEFIQRMKNEGRNEGIALGEKRGFTLGRSEGFTLGENGVLSLFSKLYAAGREADVRRATADREYLHALMREFGQ